MKIQWPTAIVLIVFLLVIGAAYLAGPTLGVPEDSHTALVSGLGALGIFVLGVMRSVFGVDTDHDGLPDPLDSTPRGES